MTEINVDYNVWPVLGALAVLLPCVMFLLGFWAGSDGDDGSATFAGFFAVVSFVLFLLAVANLVAQGVSTG